MTRYLHVDLKYTLTYRSADPSLPNEHLLTLDASADEQNDPRCLPPQDMKAALTFDAIEKLRKYLAIWGQFTVPNGVAIEKELRAQVEALDRQNSALREQTKTLRVARDTQATTIQKLQRQLDENRSAAASRVIELERQLREAEDGQYGELRKMREQVRKLGLLRRFVPEDQRRDDAYESLRSHLLNLHFDVATKEAQLKDANENIEKLAAAEKQVVSLRAENTAQDKQLDAMRAENDRLREELRSARRTLALAITSQSNRKFENNLFYGEDLHEKLTKAEAKVQKLTERLAKCGTARVTLERQLEARAETAKAELAKNRKELLALRIVLTHLYAQEKRKYAADPDSVTIGNLSVGVVTGPKGDPTERQVLFNVYGLGADGLVNYSIREVV